MRSDCVHIKNILCCEKSKLQRTVPVYSFTQQHATRRRRRRVAVTGAHVRAREWRCIGQVHRVQETRREREEITITPRQRVIVDRNLIGVARDARYSSTYSYPPEAFKCDPFLCAAARRGHKFRITAETRGLEPRGIRWTHSAANWTRAPPFPIISRAADHHGRRDTFSFNSPDIPRHSRVGSRFD